MERLLVQNLFLDVNASANCRLAEIGYVPCKPLTRFL